MRLSVNKNEAEKDHGEGKVIKVVEGIFVVAIILAGISATIYYALQPSAEQKQTQPDPTKSDKEDRDKTNSDSRTPSAHPPKPSNQA